MTRYVSIHLWCLDKYRKAIERKKKEIKELQIKCNHDFVVESVNDEFHFAGCGETLERNCVCKHCGLKAREIYIYSCTLDENDKEV
jgi:hypothetical protein